MIIVCVSKVIDHLRKIEYRPPSSPTVYPGFSSIAWLKMLKFDGFFFILRNSDLDFSHHTPEKNPNYVDIAQSNN